MHVADVLIKKKDFKRVRLYVLFFFFHEGVTINQAKIDETEIHFPDVTSTNPSHGSEESSSFLELPKQKAKVEKGIRCLFSIV